MSAVRPELLKSQLFIAGEWRNASAASTFPVLNPATGKIIIEVADASVDDAGSAISAAAHAQAGWAAIPVQQRCHLLRKWFGLVTRCQRDLAHLLTLEQGKPLAEAEAEIAYGASYIDWFADEARRVYGDVIPPPDGGKRILTLKQPVGVVAAITPWNFPNAMLARKMAPALAAGCALVAKPAAETPLSALALAYLAQEAGIPDGVINVLPSTRSQALGEVFCHHPQVQKLSFTGSTAVGKQLISQIASQVKRISLELGGNAPFIVFEDADIDAAVSGAIASKFRNAGQTCVCANRFYVQRSIYEVFLGRLIAAVEKLHIGNGLEEGVNLGPLISPKAQQKVHDLVQAALSEGATLAYSQALSAGLVKQGYFYPAQILRDVPVNSVLASEEIFGPVVPLIAFDTEDEVLELANASDYGLASYAYTRDRTRCWRLSQQLQTGMLGLNTGVISNAMAPFGGVKQSGWGREGSKYGLDDYLSIKYICEDLDN
ncbi:NAD-dependent succinate-semialdehyde dehydrogenase [Cellvibrio japonicus]|uniref:Succinate-semialdehyde dehydrogenase n=1 Tax=Cellvibrio japonicus (strain Ueda107) TaxID=498211 RepID=B3PIE7_CELJU|nr:succinate-semialdehyde dehydrogenase [Cellvibrio japonicus Ueda107]